MSQPNQKHTDAMQYTKQERLDIWNKILSLRLQGKTIPQVAAIMGFSESSILRHIKAAKSAGWNMDRRFVRDWITENQYLGRLCNAGHDYKGTGKSVRLRCSTRCVECDRLYKKMRYWLKNDTAA